MSDLKRLEVLKIIEKSFREVASDSDIILPGEISENMRILGGESPFDSMHVVNIIVLIEESILDAFDTDITLANENTMSQSRSPFRTVGTLADYIVETLK